MGNPGPDSDYTILKGDNLFSCSVVALDPATGQRKWHYQFTPNDSHDWDATEDVVLVDQTYRGLKRKLLLQADRNGIFYVLDRTNGKFLLGKPFVHQTWNDGFDKNGRPKIIPGTDASPEGAVVYPSGGDEGYIGKRTSQRADVGGAPHLGAREYLNEVRARLHRHHDFAWTQHSRQNYGALLDRELHGGKIQSRTGDEPRSSTQTGARGFDI